jgi:hypothetical protein
MEVSGRVHDINVGESTVSFLWQLTERI